MVCGQHFLGSELRYYQPVPWLTHMGGGRADDARPRPGSCCSRWSTRSRSPSRWPPSTCSPTAGRSSGSASATARTSSTRSASRRAPRWPASRSRCALVRAAVERRDGRLRGRFYSRARRPAVGAAGPGGRLPVWIGGQASGADPARGPDGRRLVHAAVPHARRARRACASCSSTPAPRPGSRLDGDFPVRRELLIAPSKEAGTEAALERYRARYETYRKWGLSGENTPMQSGDEVRADIENRFILGSPAECADAARRAGRRLGMTALRLQATLAGAAARRGDGPARGVRHQGASRSCCDRDEARGRAGRRRHRGGERDRARDGRRVRRARARRRRSPTSRPTALDAGGQRDGRHGGRVVGVRDRRPRSDALLRLAGSQPSTSSAAVDVVCNNAGIVTPRLPVWEQSPTTGAGPSTSTCSVSSTASAPSCRT